MLARGSRLMDLHGVGPVVAARTLADVGDVTRLADRNGFASWTGSAPLEAIRYLKRRISGAIYRSSSRTHNAPPAATWARVR